MPEIGLMKRINNTGVAGIITIILIVLSFIIGGVRPLSKMRREAEAVFYNGDQTEGPNAFDISRDIDGYLGLTYNIQTVADRYTDYAKLSAELTSARQKSLDADGFDKSASALSETRSSAQALYDSAISGQPASQTEKNLLTQNWLNMESVYTIIQRESQVYNQYAESFNNTLSAFPAVFFKLTGLVKPLGLFYN